jgi:hypothetical protein
MEAVASAFNIDPSTLHRARQNSPQLNEAIRTGAKGIGASRGMPGSRPGLTPPGADAAQALRNSN